MAAQALKLAREAKQETGTLRSEVHSLRKENTRLHAEIKIMRTQLNRAESSTIENRDKIGDLREDVGLADWEAIKQFVADCGHDK